MNEIPVTLHSLCNGRAAELFQTELQSVIENVMDPNTKIENIREINLKVKIRPDSERRAASVDVSCTSKYAPIRGIDTRIYFGKNREGEIIILESNPEQTSFDFDQAKPTLVDFTTGEVQQS